MRSITQQFNDGSSTTQILEVEFRKRKKAVGTSWRMDETYIKVKGKWCYLYRAVDKEGKTIDFLLTKAIVNNGVPEKITIDGSTANKSALEEYNNEISTSFEIRQVKYLNNIVEQDHRGVKRITNSMFGFKSFDSASITLTGIEIVHTLRKGQLATQDISLQSLAETFYSLAA